MQGALLQKAATMEQSVVIMASGETNKDPGHSHGHDAGPGHGHDAQSKPSPAAKPQQVSSEGVTPPPDSSSTNSTSGDWVFTPQGPQQTPPPLIWGRPDKIRNWRIAHGVSSSAVLPHHTAEGGGATVHFGGWDPCLFASNEHPDCVKPGVVQENTINRDHYERRRDMVLLLIVVVVLLSIGFDKCHDSLIEMFAEKGERHLVRMVEALMKELTVLGFISLLGSMFIRSGKIGTWSLQWFGHPPEEVAPDHGEHDTRHHSALHDVRAGHCISELTVLFEDIHLLIFCIMISLISVSAMNMLFLHLLTNTWVEAENIVRASHGKIVVAIARLVEAHKEAANARALFGRKQTERQITYLIHKSEFLHPSGNHPHHNVSVESFSFYEYLKWCCAEAVTEQTEIPSWVYGICLVLLIMSRPLFSYQGTDVCVLFVLLAAALMLMFLCIYRKLLWIERQLVPRAEKIHTKSEHHEHIDHDSLLELKPVNRLEVKTYKNFVWIRMILFGTCSPSPHEQLFWFHRKGPAFISNALRLLSFILAIFLGEWMNHMISFPYTWSSRMWSIPLILISCGMAMFLYQNCTIKSVTVTSTELMPRHDVITHINQKRLHDRQKYHKDLLDNIKILAVQRNVYVTVASGHHDWIRRYNSLPRGVQRRIHKTWKAFDQDSSGTIDRMELEQCLFSLGKHGRVVEDGASKWLKALNADEYGEGLTQQQFRVMMVAMHEAQHAPLRKVDASAVLSLLARRQATGAVWEMEEQSPDGQAAVDYGETVYDVASVNKHLFNKEMLPDHHEVIGVPEHFEAIDFLQCVRERTQFYGEARAKRQGAGTSGGLTATVSQIVAYLVQVDLEAHPDLHSSDMGKTQHHGEAEKTNWREGEFIPAEVIARVQEKEDSDSNADDD
jgi:hypothetical protein